LVEGLRNLVKEKLPDYMVPSAFLLLDQLPLSPNGKVDRKALPAPQGGWVQPEQALSLPRTPQEEILAGIWARVLQNERVGALDNFFNLGGHSLLATQVVSQIREAFQVELPLRTLFEAPTVAELARRIEAVRQSSPARQPPVSPAPRDGALPLSYAQQRLWFEQLLRAVLAQPNTRLNELDVLREIRGGRCAREQAQKAKPEQLKGIGLRDIRRKALDLHN
jgi:acyl carrier protein